jgi:hypothetical protein
MLNDAVFKVLRPNGVFVIVDHVAEAGSGMRDADTLHRIDPQVVKQQVIASGFKFDGESNLLHSEKDNHKLNVFDPAIRGHTDQFIFRFRKTLTDTGPATVKQRRSSQKPHPPAAVLRQKVRFAGTAQPINPLI